MFTTGQLIFAGLFVVGFITLLYFSYRGDKKLHKKQYKGTFWILIGFLAFIGFLVAIKYYMKQ